MAYNKEVLARTNRRIVLEMIQEHGPINRSVIAREAGLSIPTVMKITEDFVQNGLIRTIGKGESSGGKRPELLEFISDAFYIVGIDIGRRHVKAVLMDMDANVVDRSSRDVQEEHLLPPETFVLDLVDQINALLRSSGVPAAKIMGIGVGMPGIIDYQTGYVRFSPDFNWTDVQLLQLLQEHLPYRIMVDNANRALALGEFHYGAGKGSDHMFCINLGYGIGGAFIHHGEVSHGACGSSGEFGHMVMQPEGPLCDCGNRGCLEAISSGNAIAKKAAACLQSEKDTVLSRVSGRIEARDVFEAARAQDPLSSRIVDDAIDTLGTAIASVINLADPDMIVIAGGIANSWDYFNEKLQEAIRPHRLKHAGEKVRIELNRLGAYGPAIGAASMLVQAFIKNGGQLP